MPLLQRHARNTVPLINREFVDKGELRYIVFNFPIEAIHPVARKAAEAAECAGRQGRYWELHERLFSSASNLEVAIKQLAVELGLDQAKFTKCLGGESAEHVAVDITEGQRLGVTATPTLFLGFVQQDGAIELVRRISGAAPPETLRDELRSLNDHGWSKRWRRLLSGLPRSGSPQIVA